jgi:hypothetical protein
MPTATRSQRPRRGALLQLEDVALFALLAFIEPLLGGWSVDALGFGSRGEATGPTGLPRAALLLAAAAGSVACLLTRPRGEEAKPVTEALGGLAGWARFPLMVLIAVVASAGLEELGVRTGEGCFFATVIALSLPLAFYTKLPALSVPVRRLLMTPLVLLGAGAFHGLATGLLGDGEVLRALPTRADPTFGFAVFVLSLLAAGTGAFYVLLVVAPRVVAGGPGSKWWWMARFALFLAGLGVGVSVPP